MIANGTLFLWPVPNVQKNVAQVLLQIPGHLKDYSSHLETKKTVTFGHGNRL